jgi:hypothetical protein
MHNAKCGNTAINRSITYDTAMYLTIDPGFDFGVARNRSLADKPREKHTIF